MSPRFIASGGDVVMGEVWLKPAMCRDLQSLFLEEAACAARARNRAAFDAAARLYGALTDAIETAARWAPGAWA